MTTRRETFRLLAGGAGLAALAAPASAARLSEPELRRVSYASARTGAERDYFVYLPRGHRQSQRWPVILFLHGDGERGDAKSELDFVLCHGPLYEAWIQKRDLPFIVIAPQLPPFAEQTDSPAKPRDRSVIPLRQPKGTPDRPAESIARTSNEMGGVAAETPAGGPDDDTEGWQSLEPELLGMVDHAVKQFRGDDRRVYLTGLSRGGFGVWWMAAKHPDRFAAIAPVVGYGHPDHAEPIARAKLPLWQFAGARDPAVPLRYFFALLNGLEANGHPEVRFTIHEDLGHFTWVRVYRGQDLYDWFLSNRKADA